MPSNTTATISPQELSVLLKHGRAIDLIDVRTPAEYEALHIEGARCVPLDELDPVEISADRNDREGARIYVVCESGARSAKAVDQFHRAGFTNAVAVEGGTRACREAGIPVKEGRPAMSLERQVRIAAGSLVFIGTVLGAFVHPGFLFVSGFVGAGLVFAGVTNTCGMALLLAKLPWNRRKKSCCSTS